MSDTTAASPAPAWFDEGIAVLERVRTTQAGAIETAAQWCADAIAADGLVHLFGTGHSRIPVEEMFPRYGSYPGFHPIAELSMTFHTQVVGANGQRQAMFIERTPGLAEVILGNFRYGPKDVMMVFSASGLSLGGATVQSGFGGQAGHETAARSAAPGYSPFAGAPDDDLEPVRALTRPTSRIDLFA